MLQALKLPVLLSLLTAYVSPLTAQGSTLLPSTPSFEFPLASPRASAMVGRIIYLDRADSQFGKEWEGEAGVGEIWPVLALGRGRVPLTLHLGTEVFGRYSLSDPSSAQISNDWQVNLVLTADFIRWRVGVEVYHESSHMGDEYRDRFQAGRINWSRETAGLWLMREAGPVTLSLNGSYAIADVLDEGPLGFAFGADYKGRSGKVGGGGSVQPVLALHADAQEYTDWDVTLSGRAGVRFADPAGRRGIALLLTFLDGRSTQRQFFQERARYFGMEVRFDL